MEGASKEALEAAADYKSSLSDLKNDSRPVIDILTTLAAESKIYSPQLVYTIDQRLKSAPRNEKFPILCLIDSICKNVKDSNYIQLFTQNIVSNFCYVFKEEMNETNRVTMYRMRKSWEALKIFPIQKLNAIDTRIRKIDPAWPISTKDTNATSKRYNNNNNNAPINKIAKKNAENLSETRAVLTKDTGAPPVVRPLDVLPIQSVPQQQQQLPPPLVTTHGQAVGEAWLSDCDYRVYQNTQADMNVAATQQCPQPPPPQPEPTVVHVDDLLESLVHSGLIRSNGPMHNDFGNQPTSPIQIDNMLSGHNMMPPPQPMLPIVPPSLHQLKIEEDPPIQYKVSSLRILRKSLINSLYAGKQCTNCSMRFEDQDSKRYSIHLDWHFRQNFKSETTVQQPARRKWYYPLELWCQFREIHDEEADNQNQFNKQNSPHKNDSNSSSTNIDSNCCNSVNVSGVGGKQSSRSLSSSETSPPTVVASQDEEKNICSVCYEKFEKFWAEDDEEWQLRNAVRHDDNDKVYHPICLTDMLQNSCPVFS